MVVSIQLLSTTNAINHYHKPLLSEKDFDIGKEIFRKASEGTMERGEYPTGDYTF